MLVEMDVEFAPFYARHYVLSVEEVDEAFQILCVPVPSGGRWALHIGIATLVEAGVRQVSGADPEAQVRAALAKAAKGDPEGFEGEAGAVVASYASLGLRRPESPAEAIRYSRMLVERASAGVSVMKPPRGNPPDRALDSFLMALGDVAGGAGADTGLGGNDILSVAADEEPADLPPFLAFARHLVLAACARAERVLEARPDQSEPEKCRAYFADLKDRAALPRRLADAIRGARRRDESLYL